jgi:hypothetical protein
LFVLFFVVLESEPRAVYILDKHSYHQTIPPTALYLDFTGLFLCYHSLTFHFFVKFLKEIEIKYRDMSREALLFN